MNYLPPQEAKDLFRKRTYYHIQLVRDNIYLWQDRHIEFFDELSFRATSHDRSKFFEPELTPYIWLTWNIVQKTVFIPDRFLIIIIRQGELEKIYLSKEEYDSFNLGDHYPHFEKPYTHTQSLNY